MLRYLCHGLSRSLCCLPEQQWPSALGALHPPTLITALFRESSAAAATHQQWVSTSFTTGAARDVRTTWLKGLDWECLDSCMTLAALLPYPATSQVLSMQPVAGDLPAVQTTTDEAINPELFRSTVQHDVEFLQPGILQQNTLVAVLLEALDGLQWTSGATLMHLLRCVRRVWALAVDDSSLQVIALHFGCSCLLVDFMLQPPRCPFSRGCLLACSIRLTCQMCTSVATAQTAHILPTLRTHVQRPALA